MEISKNIVKRCYETDEISDLDHRVLEYNTTPIAGMGMSHAQLFFCRQIKNKAPISEKLLMWQSVGESTETDSQNRCHCWVLEIG